MPAEPSTRREVLTLTRAHFVRSALMAMTPIVLVRLLDQTEYGEYRLFWLIANSVTLLTALGMNRSLLYFIPRAAESERGAFVSQTLLYLTVVGLLAAGALSVSQYWLGESFSALTDRTALIVAFNFLWVVSSLVRTLPNADRNIAWQARAIILLAILRSVIVIGVAFATGDLSAVFIALLAFVAVQSALLVYYVGTRYGSRLPVPTVAGMWKQLEYAVPFGVSTMLASLRLQLEQWIVAVLFVPATYAIFTVALSFNAIVHVLRESVGSVLLPKMSATHAAGNTDRALQLNNRGNIAVAAVIFPVVAYVWVFAASVLELVYTSTYVDAVPILRIYLINLVLASIELTTVLMLLEQGRFVAKVSALTLFGAAIVSYLGATQIGLTGVAFGSVLGTFFNRLVNFSRAAKLLQISLAEVQDWVTLVRLGAAGAVSAAAAAWIQTTLLPEAASYWKLLFGGVVFASGYLLLLWVLRAWWVVDSLRGARKWSS